jgi:hypothetical protein
MRGVDKYMNELKELNCTRSGSKPHYGEGHSHKEHRMHGGSTMEGRKMRPERMDRMERIEHREMKSSQKPSSSMRRYATGGNVKAIEMKADGGGMPNISNVVKGRKLNAVGPKETWNTPTSKKDGGKVDRSGGGIMGFIKSVGNHLKESSENKAEVERLRSQQSTPSRPAQAASIPPFKKGGKVRKNRGGQMIGGVSMNRQAPPSYKKGGNTGKDDHREHHWMGAALGLALPVLANLAGAGLGSYFASRNAEGGSIKRKRGGPAKYGRCGINKNGLGEN